MSSSLLPKTYVPNEERFKRDSPITQEITLEIVWDYLFDVVPGERGERNRKDLRSAVSASHGRMEEKSPTWSSSSRVSCFVSRTKRKPRKNDSMFVAV